MLLLLVACTHAPPADPTSWSGEGVTLDWDDATVTLDGDTLTGETDGSDVTVTMRWSAEGAEEARLWRQGWQSWSWSGVTELGSGDVGGLAPGGDGDTYSVLAETDGTSWEAALIGRPGGASVHVGALSAEHGKVWIGATETELSITWSHPAPGALDPVRLSAGADPNALWETFADAVPGRELRDPQSGWSDWYTYYGHATEDDIVRNLQAAQGMGLQLLQVDDGWERAWGDWQANDAFPSGTAGLAQQIAAAGLTPGIWMAPLLVDRSTATYAAHPDWWVMDADGAELTDGACDCATLDVTQPDAAAWMQDQVRARVDEGWTYLKLDFLYAGAREGVRAEDVTGAEAYALAAELLRDAAGEETWILACGAPMLPSVGFADSWRSGADIAFITLPDPDRAFLRWQARSTAARAWANGRWWWNDADNLMLAADPTAALAAQVASGGPWLYGEELSTVDAPDLSSLRGVRYRPSHPLSFVSGIDGSPVLERAEPDDTVPTTWVGEDGTTVLLNVGDDSVTVQGPGGTERVSGEQAEAGARVLNPGTGEVWQ